LTSAAIAVLWELRNNSMAVPGLEIVFGVGAAVAMPAIRMLTRNDAGSTPIHRRMVSTSRYATRNCGRAVSFVVCDV